MKTRVDVLRSGDGYGDGNSNGDGYGDGYGYGDGDGGGYGYGGGFSPSWLVVGDHFANLAVEVLV